LEKTKIRREPRACCLLAAGSCLPLLKLGLLPCSCSCLKNTACLLLDIAPSCLLLCLLLCCLIARLLCWLKLICSYKSQLALISS
jgi:hypothetical protein